MFVADEFLVDLSFPVARVRLATMVASKGSLARASEGAYGDGLSGLTRAGPVAGASGTSRLADVRHRDLVIRGESAVLTLRWVATAPDGTLFPVLDADLTLRPCGEHAARLLLAGVCRPLPGSLDAGPDRAILHRAAAATIRSLLSRVADAVADPESATTAARAARVPHAARGLAAPGPP
jgi:hypothetical protein